MTSGESFMKFKIIVTRCDKKLLQSVTGITKCNNYYKIRRNTCLILSASHSYIGIECVYFC